MKQEQSILHKPLVEFRRLVSRKMENMKDKIIRQLAEQSGFNIEDYSEGGNQVFYKDERIGEIKFDLFPDNSYIINATFVPVQ
jgi:hypothetical protein